MGLENGDLQRNHDFFVVFFVKGQHFRVFVVLSGIRMEMFVVSKRSLKIAELQGI